MLQKTPQTPSSSTPLPPPLILRSSPTPHLPPPPPPPAPPIFTSHLNKHWCIDGFAQPASPQSSIIANTLLLIIFFFVTSTSSTPVAISHHQGAGWHSNHSSKWFLEPPVVADVSGRPSAGFPPSPKQTSCVTQWVWPLNGSSAEKRPLVCC